MKNALYLCATGLLLSLGACSTFQPTSSSSGGDGTPTSKVTKIEMPQMGPAMYDFSGKGPNPYQKHLDYIELYKGAAMRESERGGVPTSIILAQGLLESNAGQSELAMEANNHFGIKCPGGWTGDTYFKQDDDKDKTTGQPVKSCFRKYNDVQLCFHDHTEFLRDPRKYNRYGFLFNLDKTDYKGWAKGLLSAGYATNPAYSDQLVDLIERYQLYNYDKPGTTPPIATPNTPGKPNTNPGTKPTYPGTNPSYPNNPSNPQTPGTQPNKPPYVPPASRVGFVNDTKVVLSNEGESMADIARLYNVNAQVLADYNDRGYTPGAALPARTRVYIEEKRDSWRGSTTHHYVRNGQTMYEISQLYGIKLDKLLKRNNLQPGQEPANDQKVRLRGRSFRREKIQLRAPDFQRPGPAPVGPSTPDPGKMTTDNSELFELGSKNETTGNNPNGSTTSGQPMPGRPSTVGVPYPNDPIPTPSSTGNGNYPAYPDNPPYPTTPSPKPPVYPPSTVEQGPYHTVQKGETLYAISRKYNLTVTQLKQLNGLTSDTIAPGQRLRIQ